MEKKECFKCKKNKPLYDFYKHPEMADGHLNKCKECAKIDVSLNYRKNINHYIEYEKKRCSDLTRKKKALEYQRKRREKNPGKRMARYRTTNAIRDGKIIKSPCIVCGNVVVEAHHEDYRKPLEIIWLCRKHHLERHHKISHEVTP